MKRILFLILAFSSFAEATEVYLIGDNTNPGLLNFCIGGNTATCVGGTIVEAVDYTGQRYASQGETWNANIYTYNQISQAYYSPADPLINLSNYIQIYQEDMYLYNLLANTPSPSYAVRNGIQDAIYHLSDPLDYPTNNYVTQAQNDNLTHCSGLVCSDIPNVASFRFVDSPFESKTLDQGFFYSEVPEPISFTLIGSGLVAIGLLRRKK